MIVVGAKWGPSLINGRSDDSGHGTLAEIKLRTTNGTINILGTYWPEKPATSHVHSTLLRSIYGHVLHTGYESNAFNRTQLHIYGTWP